MTKKSKMTGNIKDLNDVVQFLNKDPRALTALEKPFGRFKAILPRTILGDIYAEDRGREWDRLRFELTNLLSPNILVHQGWRPAVRDRETKKLNRLAPSAGLNWLVKHLNEHAERPNWQLKPSHKNLAKIDIPGFTGWVLKREFKDPLWGTVASLLETGEIMKIASCDVCRIFFVRNRPWQKCCRKAACQKSHENRLSADLKARKRRIDAATTKQHQEKAVEKAKLLQLGKLLVNDQVIRQFPGGPSERIKSSRTRLGYLQQVNSIVEFLKLCPRVEKMVLRKHLE
jgi:hypothetical protein